MNRLEFIRISAGASVASLVGTLPVAGGIPADPLTRWASRHKADIKAGGAGRNLVARPRRCDLGVALHELDEIADGSLMCRGNQVVGSISGQPFVVMLVTVS